MIPDPEDVLFETLTLNRDCGIGEGALYGGYGGRHAIHPGWSHGWGPQARKEVWTNHKGQKHRLYGPAVTVKSHQLVEWYKEDILHRIGGPARVHGSSMYWFKEGKLHNLEGPAVIDAAGPKQYWIDGVKYSPKSYKWEIARRKRKGLIK
jgi:hypothetical protein